MEHFLIYTYFEVFFSFFLSLSVCFYLMEP